MTAWQRSRITERTEKGLGPVSFKRLLMAGGAAGIVALVGGRALGFLPACMSAAVVLAFVLVLTHPLEGLPLLAFGLRHLRGLATVAALQDQSGPSEALGRLLRVEPEQGRLRAETVYEAAWQEAEDEALPGGEWEYLGGFGDARGEGLAAAENPFQLREEA